MLSLGKTSISSTRSISFAIGSRSTQHKQEHACLISNTWTNSHMAWTKFNFDHTKGHFNHAYSLVAVMLGGAKGPHSTWLSIAWATRGLGDKSQQQFVVLRGWPRPTTWTYGQDLMRGLEFHRSQGIEMVCLGRHEKVGQYSHNEDG